MQHDTTIYLAHTSNHCPIQFKEVSIDVLTPLSPPIISGDTSICLGENGVFVTAPITNGSYEWVYNNQLISTNSSVQLPAMNENSILTLYLQISDGCTEAENEIHFSLNYPSPISVNASGDTLCPGESLNLLAYGSGNTSFTWTNNTNTWNTASLNLEYEDANTGMYSVFGINQDECQSEILSVIVIKVVDTTLSLQLVGLPCVNNDLILQASNHFQGIVWTLPNQTEMMQNPLDISAVSLADAGVYIATFEDQYGCLFQDSLQLIVHSLPTFQEIHDSILCAENAYAIQFPSNNYTYLWNEVDSTSVFNPTGEMITLTAIDSLGCHFTDTISIQLVDCSGQAGNIITTNDDGINEFFIIKNAEYEYDNCLTIINRWGNVVFDQKYYRNTFNGYDKSGKKLNDGVYFYLYYSSCVAQNKVTHQGFFHIVSE